jgi:hypothetical protein
MSPTRNQVTEGEESCTNNAAMAYTILVPNGASNETVGSSTAVPTEGVENGRMVTVWRYQRL